MRSSSPQLLADALTVAHRLLLQAAMSPGDDAVRAWEEWKKRVHVQNADAASHRLFSLAFRNLSGRTEEDAALQLCKGVYRRTWYVNQLHFQQLEEVLTRLHAAGIPTLLAGQPSLLLATWMDLGSRPLEQLGILVQPAQAAVAVQALSRTSWRSNQRAPGRTRITHTDGQRFWKGTGPTLELHWRLPWQSEPVADPNDGWRTAYVVRVHKETSRVLDATHQLLYLATRPLVNSALAVLPWIADALTVLRQTNAGIAWDRVVAAAGGAGLALPLYSRLRCLRDLWDAPVPDTVLDRLGRLHSPLLDRFHFRLVSAGPLGPTQRFLERLLRHWRSHRCRARRGLGAMFFTFPLHVRYNLFH